MNKEYFAELCDARQTLCEFCDAEMCDSCIVNRLIDDAYNELPDEDQAELSGDHWLEECTYSDDDVETPD